MTVKNVIILSENPEKAIEKHYAHKQEVETKSKTHIKYSDGTKIRAKSNPKAIKGEQTDAIIIGRNMDIDDETYDKIIKKRVNGKDGIVVQV